MRETSWVDLVAMAVAALAALWVAATVLGRLFRKWRDGQVVVYDHETALRIRNGAVEATLLPGRYSTWPEPVEIQRFDLRETSLTISSQEILTADALPLRLSVLVGYKIVDALAYRRCAVSPITTIYEAAQVMLRQRVAAKPLEVALAERSNLLMGMVAELNARARDAGMRILSVELKDLTLTGAAKQAYADLWKAKKEGLAALERARGEQAALRALANAARLLKGNPELMNLRVLAALAGQPGRPAPNVILGGAPGLVPVSGEPAGSAAQPDATDPASDI